MPRQLAACFPSSVPSELARCSLASRKQTGKKTLLQVEHAPRNPCSKVAGTPQLSQRRLSSALAGLNFELASLIFLLDFLAASWLLPVFWAATLALAGGLRCFQVRGAQVLNPSLSVGYSPQEVTHLFCHSGRPSLSRSLLGQRATAVVANSELPRKSAFCSGDAFTLACPT